MSAKKNRPATTTTSTRNGIECKIQGNGSPEHLNALLSPFKSPRRTDFDPDDPDYVKELQRPAVIKEDLSQMERTKRVRQILESQLFRKELESVLRADRSAVSGSGDLTNLQSLQQLSDLIMPSTAQNTIVKNFNPRGSNYIVPIADLRGVAGAKYSTQERSLRNQFGCLFRLFDLFRWSHGISNHCSTRINEKLILTNPRGLMSHEITAGQLLTVTLHDLMPVHEESHGRDAGDGRLADVNEAELRVHQAVYNKRPDVRCIVHLTTPVVAAVAAMKSGLLPICQEAMIVGKPAVHEFQEYCIGDPREAESAAVDLGPDNKVLLLRNIGFLICATSIEQAFDICHNLVVACETQIRAIRAGVDNLVVPSQQAQDKVNDLTKRFDELGGGGVNKMATSSDRPGLSWRHGELEWEAWMRILDNAGFRTGHVYRQTFPASWQKTPPSSRHIDVATPPHVPLYGTAFDTPDSAFYKSDSLKRIDDGRLGVSPNLYQRLDYGSDRSASAGSKKMHRWIPKSESPLYNQFHQQPLRITTTPHQFLPPISPSTSPNPKELKEKQKKIREQSRIDNISAGPQSKILDGVSFQEAASIKLLQDTLAEGGGRLLSDDTLLLGAASKGIVERDHVHNPRIFGQLYQANPFAHETPDEVQRYVEQVEQQTATAQQPSRSEFSTLERMDRVGYGGTGSNSPESVSLMQAVREQNMSRSTTTPPPTRTVVHVETTFDVNPDSAVNSKVYSTSPGKPSIGRHHQPSSSRLFSLFQRSKSDRHLGRRQKGAGKLKLTFDDASPAGSDEKHLSEEESRAIDDSSLPERKTKKHRFHKLSFLRGKKEKDSKNAATDSK